jgi:hypothetical protein
LFALGYTLVCNVSFPLLGSGVYLQNMHLLISVIVFLPFVMEIVPLFPFRYWLLPLLLVIGCRLWVIYNSSVLYSARLKFITSLVEKARPQKGAKFWLDDANVEIPPHIELWAISYETLLLSSLNSPDSALTITTAQEYKEKAGAGVGESLFINPFCDPMQENLPKEYFNLQPTAYRKL